MGTILSQHVWGLKRASIPNTISWSIQARGNGYNPSNKQCRLCLLEKWHILFKPEVARYNFVQSDVQYCSGELVSSCVQSNFYKCKIALITIKFLLFQAISNHKAWPGQDFQCDFAPVASVIFSLHACYVELHSMQSNWLCYMKQFCVNQGTAIFMCVLNVFNFTNVILHTMYVRIKVSFLCKCKLIVNVQNIYKSPALLSIISAISSLSSSPSRKILNSV